MMLLILERADGRYLRSTSLFGVFMIVRIKGMVVYSSLYSVVGSFIYLSVFIIFAIIINVSSLVFDRYTYRFN